MSLFDDASLIITPNAYKEGKIYAIKPTDGSGDLSVVRATTATDVNSSGLIEDTPYNLLQRSEEFSNAIWSKSNTTITANTITAPNGSLTADKLVENNLNGVHIILQSLTLVVGTTYTVSCFLKAGERNRGRLRVLGSSAQEVEFNLQNGTSTGGVIQNFGNEWYRISFTFVANGASSSIVIFLSDSTTGNSGFNYTYTGNGTNGFFIWGAQLVTGSSAREYFPTTDRLNVPRLDYTNSTCPSILVEPQRTNLALRSEEFDNVAWAGSAVVTANTNTSPNGALNADTLNDNSAIVFREKSQAITIPVNSTITCSVFIKKTIGTPTYFPAIALNFTPTSLRTARVILNTTTGTFNLEGVTAIGVSAIVTDFNDYWRLELKATDNGSNTVVTALFYPAISLDGITLSVLATGSNVFWGAQMELGSNATSYIPTVASTVTRNADVFSKTGISSLIGQTEGTLFVDVNYKAESILKTFLNLGTTTSSYIAIGARANNKMGMEVVNSSVQVNGFSTATYSTNQRLKIAMTYKLNDFKLYVNGILQATDTSGTVPAKAEVYLGSYGNGTFQATDGINSAILWKTALTDAELISLTTI